MNIFNNLIGGQILKMSDDGFLVRLANGEIRNFIFVEDEGDCCGYNVFQTHLFYSENSKENPIITKIDYEQEEIEEGDAMTITFFGNYAPLAKIDSYSSSGSGWGYGASMSVLCKETNEEEIITCW